MQNLHVVGVTNDRRSLILTVRRGSGSGSYVLEIDDHLLGLVNRLASRTQPVTSTSPLPDEPEPDRARSQLRSFLSPREIQARLRAGFSIEEVAQEAGVEESWVERFAAPVLAEREQVVVRGRKLVFSRPRSGESAMDLGDSVRFRLESRGVRLVEDAFEAGWSAQHLDSSRWIVRFRFDQGGEEQVAEWEVDLSEGSLVGLDKLSSALAYVAWGDQQGAQELAEQAADGVGGTPARAPRAGAKAKAGAGAKRPSSRSSASSTGSGARSSSGPAANRSHPASRASRPTASKAAFKTSGAKPGSPAPRSGAAGPKPDAAASKPDAAASKPDAAASKPGPSKAPERTPTVATPTGATPTGAPRVAAPRVAAATPPRAFPAPTSASRPAVPLPVSRRPPAPSPVEQSRPAGMIQPGSAPPGSGASRPVPAPLGDAARAPGRMAPDPDATQAVPRVLPDDVITGELPQVISTPVPRAAVPPLASAAGSLPSAPPAPGGITGPDTAGAPVRRVRPNRPLVAPGRQRPLVAPGRERPPAPSDTPAGAPAASGEVASPGPPANSDAPLPSDPHAHSDAPTGTGAITRPPSPWASPAVEVIRTPGAATEEAGHSGTGLTPQGWPEETFDMAPAALPATHEALPATHEALPAATQESLPATQESLPATQEDPASGAADPSPNGTRRSIHRVDSRAP